MRRANIADLKNNLSRYVSLVKKGERILVMDRDQPVAEILPYRAEGASLGKNLARLVREGRLKIGTHFGKAMPPAWYKRALPGEGAEVLRALVEERRGGDR